MPKLNNSINYNNFRELVEKTRSQWEVPGCAIAIFQDKKVIFSEGFGYRDIKKKLPVTVDTLFPIASVSKAFTTMTLAILVDEGKLEWDKPVRDYFPEFRLFDPVATERITPRDLVTHRTGLPRHDVVWYMSTLSRKDIMARLRYLEPTRDIRGAYQYNNLMYMAAGYLVEVVSGKSWEDFLKEKILEPLGMARTSTSVSQLSPKDNCARPYMKFKGKVLEIPYCPIDPISPAGGINSCVSEMAQWLNLHLNYAPETIISKNQLNEIHTFHMAIPDTPDYPEFSQAGYGLGFNIKPYRGTMVQTHSGVIDGFTSYLSLLPEINTGIIVLNNLNYSPLPQILSFSLYDQLLGLNSIDWNQRFQTKRDTEKKETQAKTKKEAKARVLDTQPSHTLVEYAGTYTHPGYQELNVVMQNNQLHVDYHTMKFTLEHYHYDTFRMKNEFLDMNFLIRFSLDNTGKIVSVSIPFVPNAKEILFLKK